ncbi:MAG: hypothetical protein IJY89_02990 [Clostridia bacterium]|nr:hypothetical protein [Clostridia bacterium]
MISAFTSFQGYAPFSSGAISPLPDTVRTPSTRVKEMGSSSLQRVQRPSSLKECSPPRAGTVSGASKICWQIEQWVPSLDPVSVQVGATAGMVVILCT